MGFFETYDKQHRHPVNRFLHFIGIPMIIVAFFVWPWSWWAAGGLFALGWILQFIGHYCFEKKAPLFLTNPLYILMGLTWWLKKLLAPLGFKRRRL